MNTQERKAMNEGYNFTGCYNSEKEYVKEEAKRIRKLGFKAKIICASSGYSVYAGERYFAFKNIEQASNELNNIPNKKKRLYENYLKDIAKLEDRAISLNRVISVNNKTLLEK